MPRRKTWTSRASITACVSRSLSNGAVQSGKSLLFQTKLLIILSKADSLAIKYPLIMLISSSSYHRKCGMLCRQFAAAGSQELSVRPLDREAMELAGLKPYNPSAGWLTTVFLQATKPLLDMSDSLMASCKGKMLTADATFK